MSELSVKEKKGETLYGFKFREPDKRRELKGEKRCFDIKQLWQRSHEILNLALLGHKEKDISKMLGVSYQTVVNTLNSTLGKEAMAERRKERDEEFDELQDRVMELTKKSLDVYEEILSANTKIGNENFNPEVTLKMKKETADTVALDMAGMRAPTKIDSRSLHMSLGTDEIEELKNRGIAAAKAAGKVIDVK
jgi:transposase